MKKLIVCIICVVLMTAFCPFETVAADSQQLTVNYEGENEKLQGAQFYVYRLGDVSGNRIIPDSAFGAYSVDYDISTAEKQSSLAATISAYILRDDITPLSSDITDANGIADFDSFGFKKGAYIVMADKHRQNDCTYFCEPAVVVLPYGEDERVTLNPKYVFVPDDTETVSVSYKVLKSWVEDDGGARRPVEIEVELLRDGEIYDTVVLNEGNNWRYKWENLSVFYHWTVTEKYVVGGYVVSLSQYDKTLLLTNSGQGEEETTDTDDTSTKPSETTKPGDTTSDETTTHHSVTTKPDTTVTDTPDEEPELPVTGLLRWPVPYLALAGAFLLIVGYAKYRKSELADE